jgi:hypothetical protein
MDDLRGATQRVFDAYNTHDLEAQHSPHRVGRCAAQHLPAPGGARDGGDAIVRGETGDQTDQESRSAGHGAASILFLAGRSRTWESLHRRER